MGDGRKGSISREIRESRRRVLVAERGCDVKPESEVYVSITEQRDMIAV